jgi:preprotein translocase subunit SecG
MVFINLVIVVALIATLSFILRRGSPPPLTASLQQTYESIRRRRYKTSVAARVVFVALVVVLVHTIILSLR